MIEPDKYILSSEAVKALGKILAARDKKNPTKRSREARDIRIGQIASEIVLEFAAAQTGKK